MSALGESLKRFFSRDAGQARTRRMNEGLSEALRYYLGPTGVPERMEAIGMLNPVQDMYEAGADMKAGDYTGAAVNTAAAMVPMAAWKLAGSPADEVAGAVTDTLAGIGMKAQGAADAGQAFAADEFGGVGPSKMRVDDLLRSEDGQANAAKSYLEGGFSPSDSPVKVAMTPDGKPYLVDGYHRAEWAAREGDGTVPVEYVDFDKIKVLYDNERSFLPTKPSSIRAYHGSPHDFDKFSMDAIGTGEGAQAYGHGLYFAENENVARGYRDNIGTGISYQDNPILANKQDGSMVNPVASRMAETGENAEAAIESLARHYETNARMIKEKGYLPFPSADPDKFYKEYMEMAEQVRQLNPADFGKSGRMYEVNINANPDDFLDWDAPLSEQPERVREWFKNRGITEGFAGQQSGNELFQAERRAFGDEAALAENMRESGLAGVKYLDHGSRFNALDGLGPQTNTKNYVVFDENLIEIVRKYGIAGAAALTGMTAAEVEAAIAE